jgi:hypothetical protein
MNVMPCWAASSARGVDRLIGAPGLGQELGVGGGQLAGAVRHEAPALGGGSAGITDRRRDERPQGVHGTRSDLELRAERAVVGVVVTAQGAEERLVFVAESGPPTSQAP